jgi:hypothetical protein
MAFSRIETRVTIPRRIHPMLHALVQDRDYLIDSLDELDDTDAVEQLSFNVHDHHWLVYCALGGHEHYDLPDIDPHTGFSIPELFAQAA